MKNGVGVRTYGGFIMNSKEIQGLVTEWYSRPNVFQDNAATYPKAKDYVDCKLLNVPKMITGKNVLNLGCCYPSDEMQFSATAKSWIAIDISPQVIEKCKQLVQKPNVEFKVGDMTNLEFTNGQFDTVIDFSSGDHLTEEGYKTALKEIYRVLAKNGTFIVTYANSDSFPDIDHYGDFGYFRSASPATMRKWLVDAGFKLVTTENQGDRIGLVATK